MADHPTPSSELSFGFLAHPTVMKPSRLDDGGATTARLFAAVEQGLDDSQYNQSEA
jgi:hypothetical protein